MRSGEADPAGVFATALRNRQDVSDSFFCEFGWARDESERMMRFDRAARAAVRSLMSEMNGGVRRIEDEAAPAADLARDLLLSGRVGAVDGTDALPKIDYMTTTKYAAAVAWLTSRERGTPRVTVTRTASEYCEQNALEPLASRTMEQLEVALDAARESHSWPTTFREYHEREVALDECPAEFVFLDGPVITQNLVTQKEGRALYERMFVSGKTFIGVIKNVSGSMALTRWSAASLKPGELWVTGSIENGLSRRLTNKTDRKMDEWIAQILPKEYIRAVYRPAQKAFAFECHSERLPLACALLLADAAKTVNHEIPTLLEAVDEKVRGGFCGADARSVNINRMATQAEPGDYMEDFRGQIDVSDEREWR